MQGKCKTCHHKVKEQQNSNIILCTNPKSIHYGNYLDFNKTCTSYICYNKKNGVFNG